MVDVIKIWQSRQRPCVYSKVQTRRCRRRRASDITHLFSVATAHLTLIYVACKQDGVD